MKNRFKQKMSKILLAILAGTLLLSSLPEIPANTEAFQYPYTMFAASNEEGAITVNATNFCINGNVCTNGTIMTNLTTSPMVNNQIDELIEHHHYFYTLSDDSRPSYDLYPENENEQNSNSYAAGLLIVSNIDDLGGPEYYVPGYEYPLSNSYFGVGE